MFDKMCKVYWRWTMYITCVTDLSYSSPASPEVKLIEHGPKPQAYQRTLKTLRTGKIISSIEKFSLQS